jgi:hypothetical protein
MEERLVTAGAVLLVAGVFMFSYSGMKIDDYQDASGVLERTLDDEARQSYENWKLAKAGSTAGMVLGVLLLVIGLVPEIRQATES